MITIKEQQRWDLESPYWSGFNPKTETNFMADECRFYQCQALDKYDCTRVFSTFEYDSMLIDLWHISCSVKSAYNLNI